MKTLNKQQKSVILIERAPTDVMQTKTREALNSGADVIAQAYLEFENFGGFADFLIKVPGKSNLGDYHYEVWDTKLSKKMKPYFAIQLCCYAGDAGTGARRSPKECCDCIRQSGNRHTTG